MGHLEDTDIIRQVLQGQQSLYALLVERYQHFVFTLALRYIGNREQAEEIAQDVFVKAYRSLGDYRGTAKFSTWLYTITHTTSLSALRSRRPDAVLLTEDKFDEAFENASGTEYIIEHKSQKEFLNHVISMLPQSDAQLLTLYYQAGQTVEEISIIESTTANVIKVRLFRARQRLRSLLETHYPKELKAMYETR